jgi:hypothetical protein
MHGICRRGGGRCMRFNSSTAAPTSSNSHAPLASDSGPYTCSSNITEKGFSFPCWARNSIQRNWAFLGLSDKKGRKSSNQINFFDAHTHIFFFTHRWGGPFGPEHETLTCDCYEIQRQFHNWNLKFLFLSWKPFSVLIRTHISTLPPCHHQRQVDVPTSLLVVRAGKRSLLHPHSPSNPCHGLRVGVFGSNCCGCRIVFS